MGFLGGEASLWSPGTVPDHQAFRKAWPRSWWLVASSTAGEEAVATPCHAHSLQPPPPPQPSLLGIPSDAASPACRISIPRQRRKASLRAATHHRSVRGRGAAARKLVSRVAPLPIFSRCRALSSLPFTVRDMKSVPQCLGSASSYVSPYPRQAHAEPQLHGSQKLACPPRA